MAKVSPLLPAELAATKLYASLLALANRWAPPKACPLPPSAELLARKLFLGLSNPPPPSSHAPRWTSLRRPTPQMRPAALSAFSAETISAPANSPHPELLHWVFPWLPAPWQARTAVSAFHTPFPGSACAGKGLHTPRRAAEARGWWHKTHRKWPGIPGSQLLSLRPFCPPGGGAPQSAPSPSDRPRC